ncbi:hypothetical protein BRADI_4g35170v3 [Brachypodium distachyon]|uniref:Uncharacterized protein n=1 Tax=Brachypodium distachyon TaxID=15368 RepID=I1IRU5_BRADI|nr:hypothetical protein BRADI_4g35170v3 [Brachypodium distachyon]
MFRKMMNHKCAKGLRPQLQYSHDLPSSNCLVMFNKQCSKRNNHEVCIVVQAISPVQCTENPMQAFISFEDFHVSVLTEEDGVIKTQIRVTVSSTMTDFIFQKVFAKHVAAAQPLPGFRQMKGGSKPFFYIHLQIEPIVFLWLFLRVPELQAHPE